jgi:hypothetical protein
MKFGIRKPSLKKRFSVRTSVKRKVFPNSPKGFSLIRNPKKATYNKIYNKTSASMTKRRKAKKKNNTDSLLNFIVIILILYWIFD